METAVLAGRLMLAAVFLAAGIGKLLDRGGSRGALREFGVPARLVTAGALALPAAELAVAGALVLRAPARGGAIGAGALLLAFLIAIGNALIHNRTPDCHCFGQLHSAPAGRATLVRNGLLLLVAAFVAWRGPGPGIGTWVSQRTTGELYLSAAIVALVILAVAGLYQLERRRRAREVARGEEIRRRSGLPPGSPAPRFDLPGACGPSLSLDALCRRGHPVVVVFADPDCCACQGLLPQLGGWQKALADRLTIALISNDDPSVRQTLCERHGITDVLLQNDYEFMHAYRMRGSPSAVIVDRQGIVASDTATGYPMIHALVRVALRRAGTPTDRPSPSLQLT